MKFEELSGDVQRQIVNRNMKYIRTTCTVYLYSMLDKELNNLCDVFGIDYSNVGKRVYDAALYVTVYETAFKVSDYKLKPNFIREKLSDILDNYEKCERCIPEVYGIIKGVFDSYVDESYPLVVIRAFRAVSNEFSDWYRRMYYEQEFVRKYILREYKGIYFKDNKEILRNSDYDEYGKELPPFFTVSSDVGKQCIIAC